MSSVLGDRIRRRRSQLRITQEELAKSLGKDQSQVWKYESGRTIPSAAVLIELTRILSTSADYLLGITNYPEPPVLGKDDLSEMERRMIQALRQKTPEQQAKIAEIIRLVG